MRNVLTRAARIDGMMGRLPVHRSRPELTGACCGNDLDELARAYGVAWEWTRRYRRAAMTSVITPSGALSSIFA